MIKSRISFTYEDLSLIQVLLAEQVSKMCNYCEEFTPSQKLVYKNYIRLYRKFCSSANYLYFKNFVG